ILNLKSQHTLFPYTTLFRSSAAIIPFPNSNNLFYIFTAAAAAGFHGICYSVIDMNLNSGLGGLVSMNTQLINPASEKLCAVRKRSEEHTSELQSRVDIVCRL